VVIDYDHRHQHRPSTPIGDRSIGAAAFTWDAAHRRRPRRCVRRQTSCSPARSSPPRGCRRHGGADRHGEASGLQASGTFTNRPTSPPRRPGVGRMAGAAAVPAQWARPAGCGKNNVACEDTPVERKATMRGQGVVRRHPGGAFDYTFVVTNNGPPRTDVGPPTCCRPASAQCRHAETCAAGPLFRAVGGTLASGQSTDVLTIMSSSASTVGSDLLNTVDADALMATRRHGPVERSCHRHRRPPMVSVGDRQDAPTLRPTPVVHRRRVLTVTSGRHRPQRGGDRHRGAV
jgi:hypothetical protein